LHIHGHALALVFRLSLFAGGNRKLNGNGRYGKVDNVWLEKGKHTFRIQRYIWWGFSPPPKGLLLRRADSSVPLSLGIEPVRLRQVT